MAARGLGNSCLAVQNKKLHQCKHLSLGDAFLFILLATATVSLERLTGCAKQKEQARLASLMF